MRKAKAFRVLLCGELHPDAAVLLSNMAEMRRTHDPAEEALIEAAHDVDGIVLWTPFKVTARIMDAAPRLTVIGRWGAGVDCIDLTAATARHIYVVNTPDANTESVAEHCVGMMIALSKRLLPADRALREGQWEARHTYVGQELQGKTLGLVGLGRVGQRVARMCYRALGMSILYHDVRAYPQVERALKARRCTLDELLRQADYVSVHVPLSAETRSLIGAREFSLCKPTSFFLSLARGPVVDEVALINALRSGGIAGAGLDVFAVEPTLPDNPLFDMENVLVTPHMAAFTEEAMRRMSMVVQDVIRVLRGKTPTYWVNRWTQPF